MINSIHPRFGDVYTNLKKIAELDINLYIGSDIIRPANVVRDLRVYLDSELSMEYHISTVVHACFFHLRRLNSIRRILGADVTSGLVSAFVTTRMDYCNSILAALPQSSIDPQQRVQNAAARLITGIGTREHITPALRSLYWLLVKYRITFKLCILMHASGAHRPCSCLPLRHGSGNRRSVWSRKT